jgi:hypothetical protein
MRNAIALGQAMAAAREAEKLKVFISYSRRDVTVAAALVAALSARGFQVTIDRRDLPFGEKWQAELAEFIRLSHTVIWLVSEASVQSNWVNWELDEVARRNKRLVPVMVAEPITSRRFWRAIWARSGAHCGARTGLASSRHPPTRRRGCGRRRRASS